MIRLATIKDLEGINLVRGSCNMGDLFESLITCDDQNLTVVYCDKNIIAGYLTIRRQDEFGKVDDAQFDVFVLPEQHGNGIGTNLVEYAISYVSESNLYNRLTLCVKGSNLQAINLYLKLGFKIKSSRSLPFNESGHTMILDNGS